MTNHKQGKEWREIHVTYVYPPIPLRCFDYCATFDGYDGAPDAGPQPVGWGATEDEARENLLEQVDE